MGFHPQPKPSRAARLRTTRATKQKAKRALSTLYAKVYKRDGYRCVACFRCVVVGGLNAWDRAHPHHIIPRSRAAAAVKHTSGNIATLCPCCHDAIGKTVFISGNADGRLVMTRRG